MCMAHITDTKLKVDLREEYPRYRVYKRIMHQDDIFL